MIRLLTPKLIVDSIYHLDLENLRRGGIAGILFDLDNTLIPWGSWSVPSEVKEWMDGVKAHGLRPCIVSNDFSSRVSVVAQALEVPGVAGAKKPTTRALRDALRILDTEPSATAIVGDQLFTDVLAGNLLGLYTILVSPLSPREFPSTKLVRILERLVMPWVKGGHSSPP